MLLKSPGAFGLVATFIAGAGGSIWAAVPLSTIRALQDAAPEAVDITAIRVDKTSTSRHGNPQSVRLPQVIETDAVCCTARAIASVHRDAPLRLQWKA